jgi:hypothetical protein
VDRLFLERGFAVFCLVNRGSARRGAAVAGGRVCGVGKAGVEVQGDALVAVLDDESFELPLPGLGAAPPSRGPGLCIILLKTSRF